jgi:hypothetical protein
MDASKLFLNVGGNKCGKRYKILTKLGEFTITKTDLEKCSKDLDTYGMCILKDGKWIDASKFYKKEPSK